MPQYAVIYGSGAKTSYAPHTRIGNAFVARRVVRVYVVCARHSRRWPSVNQVQLHEFRLVFRQRQPQCADMRTSPLGIAI